MSEQVPPSDGSESGSAAEGSEKPSLGMPEWRPDDVGDLQGYVPQNPPPLGAPMPQQSAPDSGPASPPPPPPPAPGWGTPGAPPPPEWGGQHLPPPVPGQVPTQPSQGWTPAPTAGMYSTATVQYGVVPLRPLGLGELIEGTFKTFRRYAGPVFAFSIAIALIQSVFSVTLIPLVNRSHIFEHLDKLLNNSNLDISSPSQLSDIPLSWFALWYLGFIAVLLCTYLIGSLAYSHIAGEAAIGSSTTAREIWRLSIRQLGRGFGVFFLLFLIFAGIGLAATVIFALGLALHSFVPAMVLFIMLSLIGGFIAYVLFAIRFTLAPTALALEDVGPVRALRRSSALVRGSWWRVFGYLLVASIIAAALAFAVSLPFGLIGGLSNAAQIGATSTVGPNPFAGISTFSLFMQLLGNVVSSAVTVPFTFIFMALLYTDLRMRKENLVSVLVATAEKRHRQ